MSLDPHTPRSGMRAVALAAIALAGLVAGTTWWFLRGSAGTAGPPAGAMPVDAPDAANEGRLVSVAGTIAFDAGALDPELGIATHSAALWRDVEMFQWQEQCLANGCAQRGTWSASLIDSSRFTEQTGNRNPAGFPFGSRMFAATSPRLRGFSIDAAVLAAVATRPRPATAAELPPNLAAIFREDDGTLFSGEDSANPAIGDLRVRYRVSEDGPVTLAGVQRDRSLVAVAPMD